MKIQRKRWVIMRKNRTEIWGGCAKNFHFKPITDVGGFAIKTYLSESKALAGCSSWDRNFEAVPVIETIETEDDDND